MRCLKSFSQSVILFKAETTSSTASGPPVLLRYPKKSAGFRCSLIFSTAATHSVRCICHRQRFPRSPLKGKAFYAGFACHHNYSFFMIHNSFDKMGRRGRRPLHDFTYLFCEEKWERNAEIERKPRVFSSRSCTYNPSEFCFAKLTSPYTGEAWREWWDSRILNHFSSKTKRVVPEGTTLLLGFVRLTNYWLVVASNVNDQNQFGFAVVVVNVY